MAGAAGNIGRGLANKATESLQSAAETADAIKNLNARNALNAGGKLAYQSGKNALAATGVGAAGVAALTALEEVKKKYGWKGVVIATFGPVIGVILVQILPYIALIAFLYNVFGDFFGIGLGIYKDLNALRRNTVALTKMEISCSNPSNATRVVKNIFGITIAQGVWTTGREIVSGENIWDSAQSGVEESLKEGVFVGAGDYLDSVSDLEQKIKELEAAGYYVNQPNFDANSLNVRAEDQDLYREYLELNEQVTRQRDCMLATLEE